MREEHNKIQSTMEKLIASLREDVRKHDIDVGRLSTKVTKLKAKKPCWVILMRYIATNKE